VQKLLAEEQPNSGRKATDGDRKSRPRLLRGLFVCPTHQRQLVVGGPQGRILFCPLCRAVRADKRPLFTYLNRALALRVTCQKLTSLIKADDALVNQIITAYKHAAESAQQPDPTVLRRLNAQANKLTSTIDFNRRNPGETEAEQRLTEQLLRDLRRQQTDVLSQLAAIEAASDAVVTVPQPDEVAAMLNQLGELIGNAATSEDETQMRNARRIIDALTGGRIELFQMGERKKSQGWLQGRFTVDVLSVAIAKLTGVRLVNDAGDQLEVVVDYRATKLIDEQANEAKRLWDQGLLNKQIAQQMGCSPAYVTKLLHHWFDSRGLPRPDGRRRRAHLQDKQTDLPLYKQLADPIVQLLETGLSNLAISRQLKTSDATVAKAIKWWYDSRELPVPFAADRRRKMLVQAKAMYDNGKLIKDIAPKFGYTARGLKLALLEYFAELGETMPDGRSRRGNAGSGESANGHNDPDDE
jgi:DNA-binding CsgD family transcriptional regulator